MTMTMTMTSQPLAAAGVWADSSVPVNCRSPKKQLGPRELRRGRARASRASPAATSALLAAAHAEAEVGPNVRWEVVAEEIARLQPTQASEDSTQKTQKSLPSPSNAADAKAEGSMGGLLGELSGEPIGETIGESTSAGETTDSDAGSSDIDYVKGSPPLRPPPGFELNFNLSLVPGEPAKLPTPSEYHYQVSPPKTPTPPGLNSNHNHNSNSKHNLNLNLSLNLPVLPDFPYSAAPAPAAAFPEFLEFPQCSMLMQPPPGLQAPIGVTGLPYQAPPGLASPGSSLGLACPELTPGLESEPNFGFDSLHSSCDLYATHPASAAVAGACSWEYGDYYGQSSDAPAVARVHSGSTWDRRRLRQGQRAQKVHNSRVRKADQ